MSIIQEFEWRGLIKDVTNKDKIKIFEQEKSGVYIGFDPSFRSLHLGNYCMLLVLRRLKCAGYEPLAIIGGATGQIGDPSGKNFERVIQQLSTIERNGFAIKKQIEKYSNAEVFNNTTIYKDMNIFDFLRTVGKLININYLLEKEIISSRLSTGISYAEFSYNLIQGYDFAWLYQNKNITCQIGGSDQWGNITTGIEMIRKIFGDDNKACGITINLLTKEDGTKFGKSEKGAIYLDANLTTPFEMYQFLYNQPDNQIEKLLKMLTFLSKKEIEDIMLQHKKEPFKRTAQKTLTQLIIEDIHGKEIYKSCLDISKAFYEGKIETLTNELFNEAIKSLPTTLLKEQKYNVTDLLVLVDVCKSKSQARELIKTKSISINNKIIDSFDFIVEQNTNKCMIIKKGKKNYFLIKWQ